MGAWGYANFENDAALDFVIEVEEHGVSVLIAAIKQVTTTPEEGFLDSEDCTSALAAIEFIAAAKGKPSEDFTENAEDWLTAYKGNELKDPALVAESLKAIDRIQQASELKELWDEAGETETWAKVLEGLKTRIA